jgi:hypothetical protein
MKRFLMLFVILFAGSGCAWLHSKPTVKPAVPVVSDPDVVERDLSQPYVDQGGAK